MCTKADAMQVPPSQGPATCCYKNPDVGGSGEAEVWIFRRLRPGAQRPCLIGPQQPGGPNSVAAWER